jgi:hypothetical protein
MSFQVLPTNAITMEVSSPKPSQMSSLEVEKSIPGEISATNPNTTDIIRDENLALIEVATLGTLFVLIVFGNCCVLLALALRRLKMTRMYYYLLHLCISDLITGFFTVLPQLVNSNYFLLLFYSC